MKHYPVDLHTHSNCSDGALTPTELVEFAGLCGVEILALTDHDTLEGIHEAQLAAERVGIELIPGIEITTASGIDSIGTVHVLGLGIDMGRSQKLIERITAKFKSKFDRLKAMTDWIENNRDNPDALKSMKTVRFPDESRPISLVESVDLIHGAGGIASLAHIGRECKSVESAEQLVREFAEADGDAIEGVYNYGNERTTLFWQIFSADAAERYNLFLTGGSDFHTAIMGDSPGGCGISETQWSAICERARRIRT